MKQDTIADNAQQNTNAGAVTFSVIINTYNRAAVLNNALESLAQLRHPRFEAIVVNGPSTDNSKDVIFKICKPDKSAGLS